MGRRIVSIALVLLGLPLAARAGTSVSIGFGVPYYPRPYYRPYYYPPSNTPSTCLPYHYYTRPYYLGASLCYCVTLRPYL